MSYPPQEKKTVVPPWSTAAKTAANPPPAQQAPVQQQQPAQLPPTQQQWHYSSPPVPNADPAQQQQQQQHQQYASYYQQQQYPAAHQQQQYPAAHQQHHPNEQQHAYYNQYYQQQQYSNPPPPGTQSEGPPGVVSQSPTGPPGTSNYNYNYYQYAPQYQQQPTAYNSPAPPSQQQPQYQYHYQQQQRQPQQPYYSQPPQQQVPRPPQQAPSPWAKQTDQPLPQPAPPIMQQQQQYQPSPPPPSKSGIIKVPMPSTQTIPQQQPQAQPPVDTQTEAERNSERTAMSSESWPASLQHYVQDVFANCLPDRRDQAELQLRNLILEAHRAGTLMTTDWSEVDLPSACKQQQKKKKKNKKNAAQRNAQQQGQPAQRNVHIEAPTTEEELKKLRRARRFEEDAAQFRADNVSTPLQAMHLDGNGFNQTVVGTSTKLEKNYLRLTSAPDPATVRPLPILKQTLDLLKEKWNTEQNYTYICDQFKSMRQDLTVQRIKNEFTVKVYETHARIALEKSDLGEYNQCQTQLKGLYNSGIEGHVMEFTAYRILYFLHTQNWADVNSTMADLTAEQKENEFVQHALNVRSSLANANFHRFFLLYRSAPNMGGYLMDHFVERERVQSLIILCKACRPDLPLDFIQKELAFDSEEEFFKFLTEQKANTLKANNDKLLDTRAALIELTESLKKYKKIDIKGQL